MNQATPTTPNWLSPYTAIAQNFRADRSNRLGQATLAASDFAALATAGFLQLSVPIDSGGHWAGLNNTGPQLAEIIRTLAKGDPSVALVAGMHPAVLAYWHANSHEQPNQAATSQTQRVFASVLAGHWWGTMMSEPGSGGDIAKTTTTAAAAGEPAGEHFLLSGEKHFASGSGQTSFMVTTAKADETVGLFIVDMRDKDWAGTQGLAVLREWDGHGMAGTQSHAFKLHNCTAERADNGNSAGASFQSSFPASFESVIKPTSSISGVLFAAVIVGILDEAFDFALERLQSKRDGMRALERVELVRAQNEHWQAVTLFESVRDAMGTPTGLANARQAKYAIAAHAENALSRLSKVVGGSSFSRSSPLGQWAQDVKALGFLRPPWALQSDQLFDALWEAG